MNLFMALAFCCSGGGALPKWAADALNASARSWLFRKVATLDEAFGVTKPKRFNDKRRRDAAYTALLQVLEERKQQGVEALDWQAIAARTGYGHTMLEEIYRADDGLRQFYPGKRKKRGMTDR